VLDAFFLSVEPGERFCLLHSPSGAARRAVVYVHPFAEEMNKARRMAALQARRLAARGVAVLQIDLYGCGDSSGDFADARWEIWQRDVAAAIGLVGERFGTPVSLWGLRLGAVLAAQVAHPRVDHLLLWQPVANGGQVLAQFLRLRLAGEMLASGAATSAVRELTQTLAAGQSLEIAGYDLHPDLALAIERLKLDAIVPAVNRVDWLEVIADSALPLRPAAKRIVDSWRANGIDVDAAQALGEPFWATVEIAVCEELLALTDKAFL
jgi:exosortase A-associated hydrolase 2